MQINPRAYPPPVLAHWGDDILNSAFQGVVSGKGNKNAYVFEAVFRTNNADLITLVEQKKAQYADHVKCNSTRYRVYPSTCIGVVEPNIGFPIAHSN